MSSRRLTSRDYKTHARRAPELARLKEFAAGVALGALLAGGFAWYAGTRHAATAELPERPRPEAHRRPSPESEPPAAGAASEKYDFYQMLPHFEVVVPEKEKVVKRDLPAAASIERQGVYVLQVGSYRGEADAERVRAQLALQGIEAKVQRVAVDADVWHRVRIGPISRLDELNRIRKQLHAADIDALVIRVGD